MLMHSFPPVALMQKQPHHLSLVDTNTFPFTAQSQLAAITQHFARRPEPIWQYYVPPSCMTTSVRPDFKQLFPIKEMTSPRSTIVNDNSDTFVPEYLESKEAKSIIKAWLDLPASERTFGWTQLMDNVVCALQVENHCTMEDIAHAATQVPHFPEMLEVLRYVAQLGDVHIVSDANELYIRAFLDHHNIHVTSIQSNRFTLSEEDARYRVLPYHIAPHGCVTCPANMCKTEIVQRIKLDTAVTTQTRVVYFGDGANDYCPAHKALGKARDIVFARNDVDHAPHARGLIKRIERNPSSVRAQVICWKQGKDLLELVKRHLE